MNEGGGSWSVGSRIGVDILWVKDIRESWSARKQLEERCRGQPTWVVSDA
jgi:hypothetical protein